MTPQPSTVRQVPMRYDSVCTKCGTSLPLGTQGMWDPQAHSVWCIECPSAVAETVARPVALGMAGASARRTYDRAQAREDRRLSQRWGSRAAGWIKRFTEEPQSIRAWGLGAEGEELLGKALAAVPGLVVLNDRAIPGSKANIDHIAIGPAGVFVIDAKHLSGYIEVVNRGSLFRSDLRLMIGGRNRSDLTEKVAPQLKAVSKALLVAAADPLPPVTSVLCFVRPSWGMFRRPKSFDGVRFESDESIAGVLTSPQVLDADAIDTLSRLLAEALPPR